MIARTMNRAGVVGGVGFELPTFFLTLLVFYVVHKVNIVIGVVVGKRSPLTHPSFCFRTITRQVSSTGF